MKKGNECPIAERLKKLYDEEKHIDLSERGWAVKVASQMYDSKILSHDDYSPHKSDYLHDDTKAHNIHETAEKALKRHINGGGMTPEWIKHYCDYFECSADYLIGKIDTPLHTCDIPLQVSTIKALKQIAAHDEVLEKSNSQNKERLNKKSGVMPVLVPTRIPFINFIASSKHFINLLSAFIYYLSSDTYTHLLDDTFHKIGDSLYPADENYTAGGSEIRINKDTNKALAKNLMDIYLEKLASEYKAQADANTGIAKKPDKQKKPNKNLEKTHEKPTIN